MATELGDLQRRWFDAVLFGATVSPEEFMEQASAPMPRCWFGDNVPGIDPCEGRIEGAHWIKRQTVERSCLGGGLWIEDPDWDDGWFYDDDLIALAAWDPRNGVPACAHHHARFDGRKVALQPEHRLVIWRHEVPARVEAFATDWGLEPALADRNPAIGSGF